LGVEAVSARHLRDDGALRQALGDDRRLLLLRPLASTLDTRDHLDALLVNLWPASRIEELMPWAYAKKSG
jgi:hypothetical protein